ncbi:candidate polysaccharide deacetylase from carbohydrate esterase family CE4 [Rhizoctonia solani AG-1 IB]|uniref:Candidate polysaccharide deacetylase from carbohydrate esterase family CE4 n=1 Tax=Thanatephorus cucumeris (strain AG1-IB / isolate 7/3/14) TaxID=1108050 RepID=M5BX58_THACB|nr:candidate polysaccharide deacetylase from carbohydrate esterase family CE4 [Rhizoctonia solani AG-1 IB]
MFALTAVLAAVAVVNAQTTAPAATSTANVSPPALSSTNPTAVPLSSIYASAPTQATVPLHTTYAAGATPPISGAPPLPTVAIAAANWPALDQIPPLDSPQVKQPH